MWSLFPRHGRTYLEAMNRKKLARKAYHFWQDESGQTVLEFVLMLFIAIVVVTVLKESIREFTVRLWSLLARKIAAPCPDSRACPPEEDFQL